MLKKKIELGSNSLYYNMDKLVREDGYINATYLCKKGNKHFNHWYSLVLTKKLINFCEDYLQVTKNYLLDIKKGGKNTEQGSWIHPILATNLAQWISHEFAIKVSLWIEEWKQLKNNKIIYNNELDNIISNFAEQKEREIQLKLQEILGGKIEVETETGFIDLLTSTEIIEIKSGKNWKHDLGQILIYALDYPEHSKRIHLFDIEKDEIISSRCKINDVTVTYE